MGAGFIILVLGVIILLALGSVAATIFVWLASALIWIFAAVLASMIAFFTGRWLWELIAADGSDERPRPTLFPEEDRKGPTDKS
jgi:vacuolar-type H+-ATPase subunit I/STV1